MPDNGADSDRTSFAGPDFTILRVNDGHLPGIVGLEARNPHIPGDDRMSDVDAINDDVDGYSGY